MSRLRIRTVKPEFFQDEKIVGLPITGRYLALGLVTLSDDRGRQRYTPPSILGHVFPTGDVKLPAVEKLLRDIVATGFAQGYDSGPFAYLWLPNFWRHQLINRPSESDLPPHPDDPLASLPVLDAIKAFRSESSVSNSLNDPGGSHGSFTPSRAGGRSAPVPSPVVAVGEPTAVDAGERDRAIDSALGSLGEGRDADRLRETIAILRQAPRLTFDPMLDGVLNVLAANPDGDHKAAAHKAVADSADPAFRTKVASRALEYAFQRGRSRSGSVAAVTDEKKATDDRRRAAAQRMFGGKAA